VLGASTRDVRSLPTPTPARITAVRVELRSRDESPNHEEVRRRRHRSTRSGRGTGRHAWTNPRTTLPKTALDRVQGSMCVLRWPSAQPGRLDVELADTRGVYSGGRWLNRADWTCNSPTRGRTGSVGAAASRRSQNLGLYVIRNTIIPDRDGERDGPGWRSRSEGTAYSSTTNLSTARRLEPKSAKHQNTREVIHAFDRCSDWKITPTPRRLCSYTSLVMLDQSKDPDTIIPHMYPAPACVFRESAFDAWCACPPRHDQIVSPPLLIAPRCPPTGWRSKKDGSPPPSTIAHGARPAVQERKKTS